MSKKTRKLIFEEGRFYGPKVTEEITEDDYFIDCYRKAAKQALSIIENDNIEQYKIKNRIAFLGNRGQGKTSMMRSFIKSLENKNKILFEDRLDKINIVTLDIVDPSMFEDCSNVLDVILGQMFDRVTSDENIREQKLKKEDISDITKEFNDLYNQIRIIKDKNLLNENMNLYEGAIETLITIKDISNFRKNLEKLVDDFLKLTTKNSLKSILVIPIDDIDIDLTNCYETVETVRKYLNIPNVLIVLAAKLEQLHECIRLENLNKVSKSFNEDSNRVYEDVYNMTTKYLLKLLPQNRRIHIPEIINNIGTLQYETQVIMQPKQTIKKDLNMNSESSLQNALCKMLYEKTRILILDNSQSHNYLISGNLRDVVDLYSCLYEMENTSNQPTPAKKLEIYLTNLEKFKDYFLNNWCTNNLNFKSARLIRKLYLNGGYYKNHSLIQMIAEQCSNDNTAQENLSALLKKRGKRELFYDLSDISYNLNKIENHNYQLEIDNSSKFVYGIKICYTIIMNQLRCIDELNKSNEYKLDKQGTGHLLKFVGGRILKEEILLRVRVKDSNVKVLVIGKPIADLVHEKLDYIRKNIDKLKLIKTLENKDLKSNYKEYLKLILLLSTTSKDNARDIYFYNYTNQSIPKYYFDPCLFFVNCLDIDYALKHLNNTNKENKLNFTIDDKILLNYKKDLELVAKTIICNMQLYDFYIDWLDLRFAVKDDDKNELKISMFYDATKSWIEHVIEDLEKSDNEYFENIELYQSLKKVQIILNNFSECLCNLENSTSQINDLTNKVKKIIDDKKDD